MRSGRAGTACAPRPVRSRSPAGTALGSAGPGQKPRIPGDVGLELQDVHELLDRGRGAVERRPLALRELDLPALLHPPRSHLPADPALEPLDPDLPLHSP